MRFDPVYVGHFKCNLRRIADYPNLSNYLRELYQVPGVAETVNMHHIKAHYYGSHETINPTRIVPVGPEIDHSAPHDRGRLARRRKLITNATDTAAASNTSASRRRVAGVVSSGSPSSGKKPASAISWSGIFGQHAKIRDEIEQHMVAAAGLPVEMHRPQLGRRGQRNLAFLRQLALQRLLRRLADLDAAARQLPARHIGVADQQDSAGRAVVDDGAHAERHRPAEQEKQWNRRARRPGQPVWRNGASGSDALICPRAGDGKAAISALQGIMFRLAHLSDIHLGPLPDIAYRQLVSKRILGYVNWQRNRRRFLHDGVIDAIVDDMKANAPDHIAVTGDLVNLALDREIELARLWLETLGDPHDVSVVPGNHDAYVPGALDRICRAWGPG